jgi:hypothetical protein
MQLDCGLGGDCYTLRMLARVFFPSWETLMSDPTITLLAWGQVLSCAGAIYFWVKAVPKNEWEERVLAAEWRHLCASLRYIVKGGKRPVYRQPVRLQFKSLALPRQTPRVRAPGPRVTVER